MRQQKLNLKAEWVAKENQLRAAGRSFVEIKDPIKRSLKPHCVQGLAVCHNRCYTAPPRPLLEAKMFLSQLPQCWLAHVSLLGDCPGLKGAAVPIALLPAVGAPGTQWLMEGAQQALTSIRTTLKDAPISRALCGITAHSSTSLHQDCFFALWAVSTLGASPISYCP